MSLILFCPWLYLVSDLSLPLPREPSVLFPLPCLPCAQGAKARTQQTFHPRVPQGTRAGQQRAFITILSSKKLVQAPCLEHSEPCHVVTTHPGASQLPGLWQSPNSASSLERSFFGRTKRTLQEHLLSLSSSTVHGLSWVVVWFCDKDTLRDKLHWDIKEKIVNTIDRYLHHKWRFFFRGKTVFCKQNRAQINFECLQDFLLPFLQQRLVVYPLHSESNVPQKMISSANISWVLNPLFQNSFSLNYCMWVGISKTSDLFWLPKELCGLHFSVT